MAIYQHIFFLLLAGLQCSFVMADTIMIDDFTTAFTFGSGSITTTGNGSNLNSATGEALLLVPDSPDFNRATWQEFGGAGSGFVGTSRQAVFQISSDVPDEFGTVRVSDGKLFFNGSASTSLNSLKFTYEGMPEGKIDLSSRSYFVINFEQPSRGLGSSVRVALSLSDASATSTAVLSNSDLVDGDNAFDLRVTAFASINMSQVTKIAVNLSSVDVGNEFTIRSFSFAPAPEPGAGILVGAVMSGLVVMRRLRNRRLSSPRQPAVQ